MKWTFDNIYDFVLSCGNVHEPVSFANEMIGELDERVLFDQARIYFLDSVGKVSGNRF